MFLPVLQIDFHIQEHADRRNQWHVNTKTAAVDAVTAQDAT